MIFTSAFYLVFYVFNQIFNLIYLIPGGKLLTDLVIDKVIPMIVNLCGYLYTITVIIPPIGIVVQYFVYVLFFEFIMLVVRFALGTRSPVQYD